VGYRRLEENDPSAKFARIAHDSTGGDYMRLRVYELARRLPLLLLLLSGALLLAGCPGGKGGGY